MTAAAIVAATAMADPRSAPPSTSTAAPSAAPPRSAARGALVYMGGTLASRVSGLLREVLVVALFPVRASDAFRIAWAVPNLFRELLAEGALTNAFVPVVQRLRGDDRRAFAGAMLTALTVANALLLGVAILSAPWIVDLLLAADANVDRDLAVRLLRLTFPVLMAISLSALAMGVLQAEERFLAPAWAPVALNLAAIAAMLAFPGVAEALALGVVTGGLLQALVQAPAMARAGLLPRWRWWHAAMPAALALMAPFAFTTGARQLLNVVAQRLVSNDDLFPAGAVTGYAIASMLFSLLLGLFAISPAVAFYARLGRRAAEDDAAGFRVALEEGARFIATLTVPAGVAVVLFAEPAVRVLFEVLRPAAGQEQAIALAVAALAPLGVALTASGWVNFLLRPFFVRGRVRAPVALAVATSALTAVLFVVLTPRWGIAGLSWATAVAQTTLAVVLVAWHAKTEAWSPAPLVDDLGRVILAAVVAGAAAWAATTPFAAGVEAGWGRHALVLVVGGATLVSVYAGLGLALGARDVRAVLRRVRGR